MSGSNGARQARRFVVPEPVGDLPTPHAVPSFSVVIPIHATRSGVELAVDSALSQTEPPIEVIVVDDGSPRDVRDLLGARAGQVRLITQRQAGVSAARNAGVRAARGEFVAFLDADDVYCAGFLAALRELAMARPDLDILTTDTRFVTAGQPGRTFYEANSFPVHDQRDEILRRCFLTITSAVRRQRLLDIGGFDPALTHGEDWDCWLRLVLAGARIGLVAEPLSEYRLGPDQATSQRPQSLWGRVRVAEKVLESGELTAPERAAVGTTLRRLRRRAALTTAVAAGTGGEGRRAWLAAVRHARGDRRAWLVAGLGVLAPGAAASRALTTGLVSASAQRRTTPGAGRV